MKLLALLLLAAAASTGNSAHAETSRTTCRELIANSNELVKHVNDRFNVGEVTRTDVALAELDLLEVRFECRDILVQDYCVSATKSATDIYEGTKAEARSGQRTTAEVLAAQKALIRVNGICRY
jgi:outer membrane protein TolC